MDQKPNKRLYFSSRTYALRKWIEHTFCVAPIKSQTTNSYYYEISISESKISEKMYVRISDHYKPATSLRHFGIFVTPDVHCPEHSIYMVSNPGFGNFMYATTELSELKFDITRTLGYVRSRFFIDKVSAIPVPDKSTKKKNTTSAKEKKPSSIVKKCIENGRFETLKNSPERATRFWPTVCQFVPSFSSLSKKERKAVKSLFASKIDFDIACKIIKETNESNVSSSSYEQKMNEIKKTYV